MIRLTLRIEEEEQGVCIYDETQKTNPVESEEKKLGIFMAAIREAAVNESKRLSELGRGKTLIGKEAAQKLNLHPGDSPETLDGRSWAGSWSWLQSEPGAWPGGLTTSDLLTCARVLHAIMQQVSTLCFSSDPPDLRHPQSVVLLNGDIRAARRAIAKLKKGGVFDPGLTNNQQ